MMQIKPILIFVVLLLAFAAAIESAIFAFGFTRLLVTGLMWSVGLAAMAALKLSGADLSSLGWRWGDARYHLIAFALPILYGAIAYFGAGAAGLASFPAQENLAAFTQAQGLQSLPPALGFAAALVLTGAFGMIVSMATALGEEIGWRGFLTPRLTVLAGFVLATLITGAVWASWHMPILIFSDYNGGGDTRFEIASFAIMVLAISGAFAWLRLASDSLWPAVTLHASHNLFIQSVFDPLAVRGENTVTMVGEFGVVTAGVCVLVCLPFWILGARRFARA